MKRLLWMAFAISLLTACKDETPEGFTPLGFDYFFQSVDQEGNDPLLSWTDEELSQIRHRMIDARQDAIGKTDWLPFKIWRTDTAIVFEPHTLYDTTFIDFPKINRIDTVLHRRVCQEKKDPSVCNPSSSKFYYNGELMAELDFEADQFLTKRLSETNDTLTDSTYVMRFVW